MRQECAMVNALAFLASVGGREMPTIDCRTCNVVNCEEAKRGTEDE